MESTAMTNATCSARLRAATSALVHRATGPVSGYAQLGLTATSPFSGLLAVQTETGSVAFKGTTVPASAAAVNLGSKATVMLPIRDAVLVDGYAGLRTWSPPV